MPTDKAPLSRGIGSPGEPRADVEVSHLVKPTVAIATLAILLGGALALRETPSLQVVEATAVSTSSPVARCNIPLDPKLDVPPLQLAPIAELLPEQMGGLQRAYFSMGCFWGSEAMLGSAPGVLFTRAGFTGGRSPDPSYSDIGDHVETVEVWYDPERISYEQLLDHFWSHHNAYAQPVFRQYASAIFTTDADQTATARATRERRQAHSSGDPLLTAILPLEKFYPADPGHQKYYLSSDEKLLAALPRSGEQKLLTRLATKLNAVAGRGGERAEVKASLIELGVDEPTAETLLLRASWEPPGTKGS